MPPLVVSDAEIDEALAILAASLEEVLAGVGGGASDKTA